MCYYNIAFDGFYFIFTLELISFLFPPPLEFCSSNAGIHTYNVMTLTLDVHNIISNTVE